MESAPANWKTRLGGALILFLLVILSLLRSALGTQLDTFTIDEAYHIVAGVSYVRDGDFRLNPEHPPLLKLWVGAWMPPAFKMRPLQPLNDKVQERDFTEAIVYADNNAADVQAIARRAVWAFHGILLFLLGLLLWRAAGLAWAGGTLAFLAIEPTIGAHLPVVMTDLPLGLMLGITTVTAALALATWQWRWIVALGLALGLTVGSKHSALPGLLGLGAVCLAAVLWDRRDHVPRWRNRLAKVAVAAALGYVTVWAQYGFRFHAGSDGSDAFNRAMADKIGDLRIPHWRWAVQFADDWRLLPRPYLWGLADTVRAGVEGRGETEFFIYGKQYFGSPPWFTWPAVISSKVPLALFALSLLGFACLRWRRLGSEQRWMLIALAGVCAFHFAALMGSRGTYAGVRHAMPLVIGLAIVAGAAMWRAFAAESVPLGASFAMLWLIAFGMTVHEPRLWEYHNELAGGTAGAGRNFSNEGVDLGQRFGEFAAFHRDVIQPSGRPYYVMTWMIQEEQAKACRAIYTRFAKGIDDTNSDAEFDGYFYVDYADFQPSTSRNWDPAILAPLREVARFGNTYVLEGKITAPRLRASSLAGQIRNYIYRTAKPDWAMVARRLDECVQAMPWSLASAIELGNARLKLGQREEATAAFSVARGNVKPGDLTSVALDATLAQLRSNVAIDQVKPVRNPMME